MPNDDADAIKRWSTAGVPQAKRLDYFAAAISEALYPIGLDRADPRTFRAEVSSAQLGLVEVCRVLGSPHAAFRGPRELARTSSHRFNLLMTLRSSWTVDHRAPLRMWPRDVLIIDSQYPIQVDVDDSFVAINVVVPEAWLHQWLPDPDVLAGRRIPGNSLWGVALSTFLSELSPDLVAAPPLPLSVMTDQVGALLALTASSLRSAPELTPTLRSVHAGILECIAQRCTEPQLTAGDVAASMKISVRTLHRTLAAVNETFGDKLIEAKANVALRMLTAPLFNRVTTSEIGKRAGFLSPSHFARVMRNRTGCTPLQLRRAGADPSCDS